MDFPVTLPEARRRADAQRRLLADGKDPKAVKHAAEAARLETAKAAVAGKMTFGKFADAYLDRVTPGFKNPVHVNQWIRSLKVQAEPLRSLAIRDIDTEAVLNLLRPIWTTTPESAKRLQARIEKVLNAATVEGYRDGLNPARWVGHLKETLTTRKASDKQSHAALRYQDMPAFVTELRQRTSISARALEWTILTAARTGETLLARWSEINEAERVWIIPAGRMKKSREHRVPLTDTTLAILAGLKEFTPHAPDNFIFQNLTTRAPLSNQAMSELLKGMRDAATVHGMRSSFSSWANDETPHNSKIIDFCLAHINTDATEAAYRRGDAFAKRRAVLVDWDTFLNSSSPD